MRVGLTANLSHYCRHADETHQGGELCQRFASSIRSQLDSTFLYLFMACTSPSFFFHPSIKACFSAISSNGAVAMTGSTAELRQQAADKTAHWQVRVPLVSLRPSPIIVRLMIIDTY